MKIGIYTSGLGQSFHGETVERYAGRLMNEFRYNTTGVKYEFKTEKIIYADKKESQVVSIFENNDQEQKTVYKLYEFKYNEILTCRYTESNILTRSLYLFILVIKKFPLLLKRTFVKSNYNRPHQTAYLFFLFFIIAAAILFMIPAGLELITNFMNNDSIHKFAVWIKSWVPFTRTWTMAGFAAFSKYFVTITALLLVLVPRAKTIVTMLATEFVCANNYLEVGARSQEIHGNLDQLVEYIAENEPGSKIHFHSYSFGSLIILDYLFPFGNQPSKNVEELSEALITIGTPVEFVQAYYPDFFRDRSKALENKICWLNVYSVADALATNFKKNASIGDSEFGISKDSMKPVNLNYEVTTLRKIGILNFITLYSIKAHSMYWDSSTEALSCLRKVMTEMNSRKLM